MFVLPREELPEKIEQLEHAISRFPSALSWNHEATKWENRDIHPALKRVDHKWKSILHRDSSRDEKRFLWDVDDYREIAHRSFKEALEEDTDILATCMSPNGWHFVTEPYNFTETRFPRVEYERKSDGMIFLGFLNE